MVTDKRLDQVSNLTDFDYALIVKGTDVAKVTKQQLAELVGNLLYGATTKEALASVVAAVIGTATVDKKGLAPSWLIKGSTSNSGLSAIQIDFNEYDGDSMVLCYGTNSPDGNTTRYFMLIQKEDVGRMKYQTVQNYEDGRIYRRTYSSKVGEWSPWVLDNFGANTKEELASMVAEQMGNKLFANPISINGKTVGDTSLESGAYLFSGSLSEGLTSYSGILFVSGESTGTQVRLLIGKDVIAFKRSDSNWFKITATEVTT